MNLKLIRPDFTNAVQKTFGLKVLGGFATTGLIYLLIQTVNYPLFYCAVVVVLFLFGFPYLRRMLSDWPKEKDYIGTIDIVDTIIKTSDVELDIKEYNRIEIIHNNYKEKTAGRGSSIDNGVVHLTLFKEGEIARNLKFQLQDPTEFEEFSKVLETWYQTGVSIKEEYTLHKFKTIALKSVGSKSYKELQELKKNLNIS